MAAQTNQPSMNDLVGQMSAFFEPASNRYVEDVKAAQAIKSIDPSILMQAVSQGGPLSTAEDFASSNAWTMTPEMFKQTVQGRPDAMKTAGELTSLSDAIFGRSAERKALEGAAKNRFDASADAVNSAGKMYEGAMGRQSQEKMNSDSLAQRKIEAADTSAYRKAQIGLEQQKLQLESRKMAKLAEMQSGGFDASKAPMISTDLSRKFSNDANAFLTPKGAVKEGRNSDYWSAKLLSSAYSGNVDNGYVQQIPGGFHTSDGNVYNTAVFRRNAAGGSWYGVSKGLDGKPTETRAPLVTAFHPTVESRLGGSSRSERQVPLYGQ